MDAMDRNPTPPDYELADRMALTKPAQVKAIYGLSRRAGVTLNEFLNDRVGLFR